MSQVRLDKFLASCSGSTRSEVKKQLKQHRVTVNGETEKRPERRVDPETDEIRADGKLLVYQPFVCLMFHKPAGCVTATEDRRQKTVMDFIDHPRSRELFPVGRLDVDTEGLLLIMNDGDLAHRMLAPKYHAEKTYFARVAGEVIQEDAQAFATGVEIGEKSPTLPAKLEILDVYDRRVDMDHGKMEDFAKQYAGAWPDEDVVSEVYLTICEGKFHQVKRMFEARGKKVLYLKRISMAGLELDETLAPGMWRELTKEEMERLLGYVRGNQSSDF